MNTTLRQKMAYITAIIYTALIGIGMFTAYHINGTPYNNPQMTETLVWFEIVMTIFAFIMAKKYFSWQELGFGKINIKNILWFAPMLIIGTIIVFNLASFAVANADSISPEQWKLFSLICFTTFLVGLSEELVYRGVVFASFIKENKVKSLLISAVTFSLLHSVNVFGGLTFTAMLMQLAMTFVAGLFFGFVRMKIDNIVPIIIFHWAWDFSLIGGDVINVGDINNSFTVGFIVCEILFAVTFVPYWVYRQMRDNKAPNKLTS